MTIFKHFQNYSEYMGRQLVDGQAAQIYIVDQIPQKGDILVFSLWHGKSIDQYKIVTNVLSSRNVLHRYATTPNFRARTHYVVLQAEVITEEEFNKLSSNSEVNYHPSGQQQEVA